MRTKFKHDFGSIKFLFFLTCVNFRNTNKITNHIKNKKKNTVNFMNKDALQRHIQTTYVQYEATLLCHFYSRGNW